MHTWKITKIVWVVIDVEFTGGYVPSIYEALEVKWAKERIVLETQQQLGDGVVRTISMNTIDGLKRGMVVEATESPIRVPVWEKVLWRMFNVLWIRISKNSYKIITTVKFICNCKRAVYAGRCKWCCTHPVWTRAVE